MNSPRQEQQQYGGTRSVGLTEPAPRPTIIEDDVDSAYATSASTETTSIASWIHDFRVENGRTYHAFRDGKYWGANDEAANQHLDIAHALYTKTFGGRLFLAPIVADPSDILDLGTGTGIWAIDVADEYPSAVVVGTDLSPTQPTWVPPNCKFEIDDFESDWTFPENHFDYIHLRGLYSCVNDWPAFYAKAMRCLKPGGYIEQAEYSAQFTSDDSSIPADGGIAVWNQLGPDCHAILNRELQVLETMKPHLVNGGFEDVILHEFKWPIGPWAKDRRLKELGGYTRVHIDSGLENWILRLCTTVMGWTVAEVDALCAKEAAMKVGGLSLLLNRGDRQVTTYIRVETIPAYMTTSPA